MLFLKKMLQLTSTRRATDCVLKTKKKQTKTNLDNKNNKGLFSREEFCSICMQTTNEYIQMSPEQPWQDLFLCYLCSFLCFVSPWRHFMQHVAKCNIYFFALVLLWLAGEAEGPGCSCASWQFDWLQPTAECDGDSGAANGSLALLANTCRTCWKTIISDIQKCFWFVQLASTPGLKSSLSWKFLLGSFFGEPLEVSPTLMIGTWFLMSCFSDSSLTNVSMFIPVTGFHTCMFLVNKDPNLNSNSLSPAQKLPFLFSCDPSRFPPAETCSSLLACG